MTRYAYACAAIEAQALGVRERFCSGFCVWITPVFLTPFVKKKRLAGASVSIPRGVAGVCSGVVSVPAFGLDHACLFDAFRQKEAACGNFRFYSAHRAAGVERSHGVLRSLAAAGLFELFTLFVPAARERGLTVWRFLVIAYLFGVVMLSAGNTLGLRAPNPRQRAIGSLDSPQLRQVGLVLIPTYQKAARLNCRTAFATLGYSGDLPSSNLK